MWGAPFKRIYILNAESVFGAAKSYIRASTTKPGGVSQPGDRRANVNSVPSDLPDKDNTISHLLKSDNFEFTLLTNGQTVLNWL